MLKVPLPSPPVPQVSIASGRRWATGTERRRMAAAAPAISSTVSPLVASAASSAAWTGASSAPSISAPISSSISARPRSSPEITRRRASVGPATGLPQPPE